jgi:hypothetical protein
MASVTLGIEPAGDTTNASTYATGAFTPAAGDLLVAIAGCSTTVDAGAYTSNDAGKTYSLVDSGVCLVAAANSTLYAFVGDQAAGAVEQTGTMDVTGDAASGCAQAILQVAGMSKFGASAIRQFKSADNQTAGTAPTITFDAPCLTGNPTIMAIYGPSATNVTAPDGWTQIAAPDHATPTAGIVVWARDSGFTGDTITAGGTFAVAHAIVAIELDASAPASSDTITAPTYGAAPHTLTRERVLRKYEEIEAIERHIQAKEEAEREKVRKQEEAKKQLAELEDKKRQTKTIAERRRKLEARIAAYQSEITDLRETMIALLEEIERARAAFELQQTIADRRRRMLLMIAAAA